MTQQTTLSTMRQTQEQSAVINMGFATLQSFELMQRAAKLLSSSTLVPIAYRAWDEKKGENPNALANCVVAINMSQRMGADPLMVMQNLYIVEGRPSWSSQWIIAAINGCGRFSPLRFDMEDLGSKEVEYEVTKWVDRQRVTTKHKATVQNLECIAWAIEKETGARIDSPKVSIEMAVKEGWYGKSGSKWQTMPEVMLRYRTASFFGKLYAPELLMGLQTVEEAHDIIDINPDGTVASVTTETLRKPPKEIDATVEDDPTSVTSSHSAEQNIGTENVEQENIQQDVSKKATKTTYAEVMSLMNEAFEAKDIDKLNTAADLIKSVSDKEQRVELRKEYNSFKSKLETA